MMLHRARRIAAVAVTAIVLGACASSQSAQGTTAAGAPRGSANLILASEFQDLDAADAYTIIQRLRPRMMLASSGPTRMQAAQVSIRVYVDQQHLGGVETLRQIPKGEIAEIRYFSPTEAVTRFGAGNDGGVIQVRRKAR